VPEMRLHGRHGQVHGRGDRRRALPAGDPAQHLVLAWAQQRPVHDWPPATIQAISGIAQVLRDKGLCAGRIVYTPKDIPALGTTFHAIAVRP
jgi:hypothetical protein